MKKLFARVSVGTLAILMLFGSVAPLAHAAVDRAVVDSFSPAGGGNIMVAAHFMDGSTEDQLFGVSFPAGSVNTQQDLITQGSIVLQNYAANQGYTLTNGIIWPFVTTDQLDSAISTAIGSSTLRSMVFTNPTRSLNTAFQMSTTSAEFVSYTVDVETTLSELGGQVGTVTLQYADDSGFTTNVKTLQSTVNGSTGTLTEGLSITQSGTATVTGIVPVGKYVRILTEDTTGTPTFTFRAAQEVLLPSN